MSFGGGGSWLGSTGGGYGPSGPYGAFPACGCSSLLIVIAGIILVCAGGLRMFHM